MTYRIKGTLKLPSGQPAAGVDIEFTSVDNKTPVVVDLSSVIKTTDTGGYDVTLEGGEYSVTLYWMCAHPSVIGRVLIDQSTPVGLDLPQLLRAYRQLSTAPDYAQLIEKWLAEAKSAADTSTAQAASAKSQADRAKSEADRASQISGLDTVADAVGLAAVPFPDVWIPFNDSLRMFAGYGREVKVGDDVVARMVNFERSTTATYIDKSGVMRTAAINEPRFEKQGLLIEGQSTNLFTKSSGVGFWVGSGSDDIIESSEVNPYGVIGDVLSIVSKAPTNLYKSVTAKPSTTYTFSIFFRVKPGTKSCSVKWGFESRGILGGPARVEIDCLTLALISRDNGVLRYGISRLSYGWCRFDVSARTAESPVNVTLNISEGARNIENTLMIFGWQLEELPFASSYIPTNGTAVTRSADKCWIQWDGNICSSPISMSMTYDLKYNANYRVISYGDLSRPYLIQMGGSGAIESYSGSKVTVSQADFSDGTVLAVSISNANHHLRVGGKFASQVGEFLPIIKTARVVIGGFDSAPMFGHIRNLRIWHHALTDAQIKGLK